jgi:hypothetical protein
MVATLNWTAELSWAPRRRDPATGLRDAACFAQDLALAIDSGFPACVVVIHVRAARDRRMRRVAKKLARVEGFVYRTGPDTLSVIAPGVSALTLCGQIGRARLRGCLAGVAALHADVSPQNAALTALGALQRAEAGRVAVSC